MKVCPACSFENPDVFLRCLRCNRELPLTLEQSQEIKQQAAKLTDNLLDQREESLLNSWAIAMAHRFDWLWNIGARIQKLKYQSATWLLILLIFIVLISLSIFFNSIAP